MDRWQNFPKHSNFKSLELTHLFYSNISICLKVNKINQLNAKSNTKSNPKQKQLLKSMLKHISDSNPDERILKLDLRREDLLVRRGDSKVQKEND